MEKKKKESTVIDNGEDKEFNALLSLYSSLLNDITFYQNSGNNVEIVSIIAAIAIPVLQFLKVDLIIQSVVCLALPFVQAVGLQRGLESHSFVAMLRGYAAFVELKINGILGKNDFLYNSELVDEYIAKQRMGKTKKRGMKYSMLITLVGQILMVVVSVFFFYIINLANNTALWILIVAGVWFLVCSGFDLKICVDFIKKERVRKQSLSFCKAKQD